MRRSSHYVTHRIIVLWVLSCAAWCMPVQSVTTDNCTKMEVALFLWDNNTLLSGPCANIAEVTVTEVEDVDSVNTTLGTNVTYDCTIPSCTMLLTITPQTHGELYLPPVVIGGTLSTRIPDDVVSTAAVIALFESLWQVVSGRCTVDVLWESQRQFVIVVNAPSFALRSQQQGNNSSSSALNMANATPPDAEIVRGSLYDPIACSLAFASAPGDNALIRTAFGAPGADAVLDDGVPRNLTWSTAVGNAIYLQFAASVERSEILPSSDVERGLGVVGIILGATLLPTQPLLFINHAAIPLLLGIKYCSTSNEVETSKMNPLTIFSLSYSPANVGDARPPTWGAAEAAFGVLLLFVGCALLRCIAVGCELFGRPRWSAPDVYSGALLSTLAWLPAAFAMLLLVATNNTVNNNTRWLSVAATNDSAIVVALLIASGLIWIISSVGVVGIYLPMMLGFVSNVVPITDVDAARADGYASSDAPASWVLISLGVVVVEDMDQPSMPYVKHWTSIVAAYRVLHWAPAVSVSLLGWLHVVLVSLPGSVLDCFTAHTILAVTWLILLFLVVIVRPMHYHVHHVFSSAVCLCVALSCGLHAAFLHSDRDTHALLVGHDIATVAAWTLWVMWMCVVGCIEGQHLWRRILSTHRMWDGDGDKWWDMSVRTAVRSVIQHSNQEDQPEPHDENAKEDPEATSQPVVQPVVDPPPPVRPFNLLHVNFEDLINNGDDEDHDWRDEYESDDDASRTGAAPRLPLREWTQVRNVDANAMDALLTFRDRSASVRGQSEEEEQQPEQHHHHQQSAEGHSDASSIFSDVGSDDDIVVDYADVQLLGGHLNHQQMLAELL